ncbi:hypothetical protein P280DRAFT_543313 [Massarina eburnea CBS 473.64]|uniref:Uncharacterized protein n=1 Tax=Massarina eburnea CBS 473.64 TaxID=1395130 RepID=A0A6A6RZR5_9PLEO|nr:hypothetical protein P280DRAFT_543313 [Massarina eburnea CBS 473.64]
MSNRDPPTPLTSSVASEQSTNPGSNSNEESDIYVDAPGELPQVQPSLQVEMRDNLTNRAYIENIPQGTLNITWQYLTEGISKILDAILCRIPPSLDADILADPMKQREVREITNYKHHGRKVQNEHSEETNKEDALQLIESGDWVRYTGKEERDRAWNEEVERREFEMREEFEDELHEWDDCFLPDDDPRGWVTVLK